MKVLAAVAVAIGSLAAVAPASASSEVTGRVAGIVTSEATGRAVAGAVVSLPDYGVRTVSASDGSFAFAQPLATEAPYRRIRAVVRANGWGRWSIGGVPLYPSDTLQLDVALTTEDFDHHVLSPAERSSAALRTPVVATAYGTCTGWSSRRVPPPMIRVHNTDTGQNRGYKFLFYVRHVLPNEWISSWDADALGAGAIAAKEYAWWRTQPNHAYSGGSNCADVQDSVSDQVFDPTWSTAATDQAVYATFGSVLWRDGAIPLTQYWAGSSSDPCAAVTSPYPGRMSQWGTQNCALAGKLWPEITQVFYEKTSWPYLNNLMLAVGAEDGVTYPWHTTNAGSLSRTDADPYKGAWSFRLGADSMLWQRRAFNGAPSTPYTVSLAMRCPRTNGGDCASTLTLVARTSSGSQVARSMTLHEPNDGAWRTFTFRPDPAGVAHASVEFRLSSGARAVEVDALTLRAPFGGR